MGYSVEPVKYDPHIVTLPNNRTIFCEVRWVKDWEDENDTTPFVSLSNDNATKLFSALGLQLDFGLHFKASEMRPVVLALIERGAAFAGEFSCGGETEAIATQLGAKVIDLSDNSGAGVIERANRLLQINDWAIATYGEDARCGIS